MPPFRSRSRRSQIVVASAVAVVALALVGAGNVLLASGTHPRLPPPNATVDYQLGGPYDPAPGVGIVTRDSTAPPAAGVYNICYLNAFQTQPGDASFWTSQHPELILRSGGEPVSDPEWPGEYVVDVSTEENRAALLAIESKWIDGCAADGYDAVEPDNLDTYARFPDQLTEADALAFAQLLADRAHAAGLAIGQKNAAELGEKGKARAGFDFAVVEECEQYSECDTYTDVYGRYVLEIEYTDGDEAAFPRACAARGDDISIILRDRDVVPKGTAGYEYESC